MKWLLVLSLLAACGAPSSPRVRFVRFGNHPPVTVAVLGQPTRLTLRVEIEGCTGNWDCALRDVSWGVVAPDGLDVVAHYHPPTQGETAGSLDLSLSAQTLPATGTLMVWLASNSEHVVVLNPWLFITYQTPFRLEGCPTERLTSGATRLRFGISREPAYVAPLVIDVTWNRVSAPGNGPKILLQGSASFSDVASEFFVDVAVPRQIRTETLRASGLPMTVSLQGPGFPPVVETCTLSAVRENFDILAPGFPTAWLESWPPVPLVVGELHSVPIEIVREGYDNWAYAGPVRFSIAEGPVPGLEVSIDPVETTGDLVTLTYRATDAGFTNRITVNAEGGPWIRSLPGYFVTVASDGG